MLVCALHPGSCCCLPIQYSCRHAGCDTCVQVFALLSRASHHQTAAERLCAMQHHMVHEVRPAIWSCVWTVILFQVWRGALLVHWNTKCLACLVCDFAAAGNANHLLIVAEARPPPCRWMQPPTTCRTPLPGLHSRTQPPAALQAAPRQQEAAAGRCYGVAGGRCGCWGCDMRRLQAAPVYTLLQRLCAGEVYDVITVPLGCLGA